MQATQATLAGILTDATATAAIFDPVTTFVGVFTAIVDHGLNTTLANLTLPAGASATNVEVTTWGAVYYLDDGSPVRDAPVAEFHQTGADPTVTIIGWFLGDANPATLLKAYGLLPAPVILAPGGTQLNIVARLTLPQATNLGVEVVYDG